MPTLTRSKPTLEVSVDFAANPTARYSDIHETDDGVVSFWRHNATATLLDELGLNNGVQISTGATTAGPYPYDPDLAVTYDGTNDSAYVPNSVSLTQNTAFSVDGWFKVSALPAATLMIAGKQGSWKLELTSTGKLVWTLKDDTSTLVLTSGTTVQTNLYYYVAGVYDDANSYLYVNGLVDVSGAYASGVELGSQPIRFAGRLAATAPTFQSSTTASGSSTSATGTAPASIASGDLLIAHVACHSATTAPSVTAVPTDWVLIDGQSTTENSFSNLYYKIATGSEPANYTWTISPSVAWHAAITRITGQDTVAFLANAAYAAVFNTNTVNKTTGSHVANMANSLRLDFVYSRGATLTTFSSGTERYDFAATNVAAMASQVPSETSLAQTITSGNSEGIGQTLHIAGTGVDELGVTLKDWTYWNRALDADDVGRNYWSKDSGDPTWTNITLETRYLSCRSPERRHELDTITSGGMDMVLREVGDKDFDPGNTSSPYLPDIQQRVRIRATWNSTTYDVFRGYAGQWRPIRLGADKEEVQFTATDGFEALTTAPVSGTIPVAYSGEHISAILDKALWPLADRDIDTGQYVLNGYTIGDGTFALNLLQEIAASERGICFIDAANVFHFHDAAHRGSDSRSTTSQATFSDWPGGNGILAATSEIRYQGIQPTRDKDKIVNIWTVSPDSGVFGAADQTVIDHESRAKYFAQGQSRSTKLSSNEFAEEQAGNLLTETAFPADRYESMRVIPLTVESYDKCLDLRISDRVTVKRGFTPGWPGTSMTRDYFVEGKTIDIQPDSAWVFEFVLSPVSSGNYYQTIMRDGPVSYWRLDTTT